jgi:hypothetical protein
MLENVPPLCEGAAGQALQNKQLKAKVSNKE